MISVCPTVTADEPDSFRTQMEQAVALSNRIHLDVADGRLAPRELLPVADVWWSGSTRVDIHMMYEYPLDHVEVLLALKPQLVIVHAEAKGSFVQLSNQLRAHGIEAGVALLPETPVEKIVGGLEYIDHVLIFSGNLGYQGGSEAQLKLLEKASQLKKLKPQVEIGWDGGVNADVAGKLVEGGVEVLNVGGYFQSATDKRAAWEALQRAIGN
ncbi:MAG: rpe, Ribulose-phosphate 3-epimerase [Candidatus Saccharibacteria bacterium]|nr:rpe, Ribulose-phosphate 3-epimerase [Candidatus Saccharibacteria bacterium]